jgi:hypothetical protein
MDAFAYCWYIAEHPPELVDYEEEIFPDLLVEDVVKK